MIVNKVQQQIDSNVPLNKTISFGIDAENMGLVMEILSKLYAHPIRTLVQEYICNGRDAMREAGTWGKQAMVISVPNRLEPTFKVRDYGVGITPERMNNVFVLYGSSTKRTSNVQTGGFGIGSKSFRCYTDSMSVTSFVNGIKYTYIIQPDGVLPLSQEKTTELNGVEISIGVKGNDVAEFQNAVRRCVQFWQEPIKFLGIPEQDIQRLKPIHVLDNLSVYEYKGASRNSTFYLIDGIQYELIKNENGIYSYERFDVTSSGYLVAINLPNGALKIASSRERIENNDSNKAIEQKLVNDCQNLIIKLTYKVNSQSDSLANRIAQKEKYKCFSAVKAMTLDISNGYKLDNDYIVSPSPFSVRYRKKSYRSSKIRYLEDAFKQFQMTSTTFINIENDKEPNTLAKRINFYLETNPTVIRCVTIPDDKTIPYMDLLKLNVIDSTTLLKPASKPRSGAAKSTRDALVYQLGGTTSRAISLDSFNKNKEVIVTVDEETPEAIELGKHMEVYRIPKCNKSLVTKKSLTVEQGKKYLLKKYSEEVTGISSWYGCYEHVDILKQFKRNNQSVSLSNYLLSIDPKLQNKADANKAKFDKLLTAYPLIKVLPSFAHYETDYRNIVIDEINKQTKGKTK